MNFKYSIFASMFMLVIGLLSVGCSSGGGSNDDDTKPKATTSTTTSATTSVGGTTGSGSSGSSGSSTLGAFSLGTTEASTATSDTVATLVVDSDGDSKLTSSDTRYVAPVLTDGSFFFDKVTVSKTAKTLAELTVEKEGFAPVVKQLLLTKDTPLSVLAKMGDVPVFTEVTKLPVPSQRANTYLKFGITKSSNGLQTFSKLMTLSELKAEAEFGDDSLSVSSIPTSAFADNVKSVTAKFQAFDSTDEKDISFFPGAFTGHGRSVSGSATNSDTENPLESAAFDMIDLTDQNGNDIVLNISATAGSKLSALDASSCGGMYWVRRVNTAQAAIIDGWGDADPIKNGTQVPIWSNDNSTSSWKFVGDADYNASSKTFSICVDRSWQNYLNCDSEISVGSAPKQLCVNGIDQFGNAVSGVNITGKDGNTFANDYMNNGKATLSLLADASTSSVVNSEWSFTYRGAITDWSVLTAGDVVDSTVDGCDYELDINMSNPYFAEIRVQAYSKDDNTTPLINKYVTLSNTTYANYYSKYAYTDSNGFATFKVKPNVEYTARYEGGTAIAKVDNIVNSPETVDTSNIVIIGVSEQNAGPSSYIRTPYIVKDTVEELHFSVSSNDRNGDTLTMQSLTLNGVDVTPSDYTVVYKRSVGGSYNMNATLNLNSTNIKDIVPTSLSRGRYTMSVTFSDGKLTSTSSSSFTVAANNPPVVSSIYFRKGNGYTRYFANSPFVAGTDYSVHVVATDIDGDSITKTVFIDGVEVTDTNNVTLTDGDHNISAVVTEEGTAENYSASKDMQIFVGNIAPVINSVVAMPRNRVDIATGETFRLKVIATDVESPTLTLTATDENGNVYQLIKSVSDPVYWTLPITLTTVKDKNNFVVVANDGDKNSTSVTVSIESYKNNLPPVLVGLNDRTVEVNTQQTFMCNATDPEGTYVTYSWSIDNVVNSETSTTLTHTFTTTGGHSVSCTATDSDLSDPKSSTSTATVLVTDPTAVGTLTVHTGYEGIKVTRHNNSNFALLEEKHTDANGDVTFSVTGDRTTFAITSWSGMAIHKNLLMEIIKEEMDREVKNECDMNNSVVSQCSTVDWCAMYEADTIETWVWQLYADNDEDNETRDASVVDTDSDGKVSADELYAEALATADKDSDGKISFAEMDMKERNVDVEVFANVPVREYYMDFDPIDNQNYETSSNPYWECGEDESLESNVTLHYTGSRVSGNKIGDIFGSGYGWLYGEPNSAGDLNMSVRAMHKDTDGTYSFLVREKDSSEKAYNYSLLSGKTKAQLEAGLTLDVTTFSVADKNVTLRDVNNTTFNITTLYKGLHLFTSDDYLDSSRGTMFYTNPAFTYSYKAYNNSIPNTTKWHYGYYTDTALQSNYDPDDYPFLDVNISFPSSGTWSLSGSDMGKLNTVSYELEENVYDENTSTYSELSVTINWTVAPTTMPTVDILSVMPTDVKADVAYIISLATGYSEEIDIEEFKGLSETEFLDIVAGSSHTEVETDGLLGNRGKRGTNSFKYTNISTASSTKARKATIFTIDYDTSHIFSK